MRKSPFDALRDRFRRRPAGGPNSEVPFVTQMLEPTGGKIPRPADWFYAEAHGGPTFNWTLSREDPQQGPYITGMRIQLFTGVRQGTGKSPRTFMLDLMAARTAAADGVLHTCAARDQGLFTRTCLETLEGRYHVLYSLFWGNKDLDLAVVTIAGTTRELWESNRETFDRMTEFELIDMERFG